METQNENIDINNLANSNIEENNIDNKNTEDNGGGPALNISVLLFFAALICYFISDNFQSYALISWWQRIIICLPVAFIVGLCLSFLLRRAFDVKSFLGPIIVGTITAYPIVTMTFYMINDYMSKPETGHIIYTTVEDRYKNSRWFTRSSTKDEYLVFVRLPDGTEKKYDVHSYEAMEQYNVGDIVPLWIEDGYFGFTVIKNALLPAPLEEQPSEQSDN